MYPVLAQWGEVVIPAWHALYLCGAFAAYALMMALRRRFAPSLASADLGQLYAVAYVCGYFGARLLSIVIEEEVGQEVGTALKALFRLGPMTFYGGALAAFAGGWLYCWWRRLPVASVLDLTIPAALLALAIGRIGCWLNGDDYGKAAPLGLDGRPPFWAAENPVLGDHIARWPVQLIEAASVGLIVLGLWVWGGRVRSTFRSGAMGYLGLIIYANLRFFLEFLRDDFRGSILGTWLSTSQFISLLILLACGLTLPFWIRSRTTESQL